MPTRGWRCGAFPGLFAALLLLTACLPFGRGSSARALPEGPPLVGLWVERPFLDRCQQDPAAWEALCRTTRAAGITHLAVELRGWDGAPPSADKAATLLQGARLQGLRLAAVQPLFAGAARRAEDQVQRGVWAGDRWRLEVQSPPRRTPALASHRTAEAQALVEVLKDPRWDFVLATGLGFEDLAADLGPTARRAFEASVARSILRWPEEVLGDAPPPMAYGEEGRGELWSSWLAWRAGVLRAFVEEVQMLRRAARVRDAAPLIPVVDAPWPLHLRSGFNWGGTGQPWDGPLGWLPTEYRRSGAGDALDGVALLGWPVEGVLAPWAEPEAAVAAARRMLPAGRSVMAVLPLTPAGIALAADLRAGGVGVVFLSAGGWTEDVALQVAGMAGR